MPGSPPGSVWDLKPWWCQPWTILVTGMVVIGASWLVLHLWWITAGVSAVIAAWWLLFLVLMPAAWKRSQAGGSEG
ncbi:hypothetical protein KBZ08_04000 [Cyanobium sp. Candia 9D4]|jgi:hypothetical protein|uniref:DUF6737 family protein n=1 Tax=Cyanobium sp. Candia 9D4 TaxID=2823707 RepID=UPI0020CCE750|nr:DUF6737 family protein [Cyanobium sp. Candia 9D4]MCP9933071.1 hypothetical protein [Cyanobium sp. Candia 9D4]